MMKVRSAGSWLAAALLLVALIGCGGRSDLGRVTGTVTLDGKPLSDAMVVFTPMTGGRPGAGLTDAQGKYEIIHDRSDKGAVFGEHVVEISTGDELSNEDDTVTTIPERVPAKYNSASELRATVEAGANVFDFALTSEGEIVDSNEMEASDDE